MYRDNILDKRFADELYWLLLNTPWHARNIANRNTYPYGDEGSHLFLGKQIFWKENEYDIYSEVNKQDMFKFINLFEHLCNTFNVNLKLKDISVNLQFFGQDGTFHTDGDEKETVFILMLCNKNLDQNIGGNFINQDTKEDISFKHGRVITFRANNKHKGLAFNKPYIPRISVKFVGE
tara:strand:- start:2399 stop:2932 length:534 start_codon:yes stop_codon:yes gene_type:complete